MARPKNPKPKVQYCIWISPEMKREVKIKAVQEGKNEGDLIEEAWREKATREKE